MHGHFQRPSLRQRTTSVRPELLPGLHLVQVQKEISDYSLQQNKDDDGHETDQWNSLYRCHP